MSEKELLQAIKNRNLKPVYLFYGDEPFFIDQYTGLFEKNFLTEEEKSFNYTVLYGYETDMYQVTGECRRYPLIGSHSLVIVKEAQKIKDWTALEKYLENPLDSTVLVLAYKEGAPDRRKTFFKAIEKKGLAIEFKKLYDNQLPDWIKKYVSGKGYRIDDKTSVWLAEMIGNDLRKLTNTLEQIFLLSGPDQPLTIDFLSLHIGISKDFNVFELIDAIGSRNIAKATLIVNYLGQHSKENPFIMINSMIFRFFQQLLIYHQGLKLKWDNKIMSQKTGLHFYHLKKMPMVTKNFKLEQAMAAIEICAQMDAKSKGINAPAIDDASLLKELIFKILSL